MKYRITVFKNNLRILDVTEDNHKKANKLFIGFLKQLKLNKGDELVTFVEPEELKGVK